MTSTTSSSNPSVTQNNQSLQKHNHLLIHTNNVKTTTPIIGNVTDILSLYNPSTSKTAGSNTIDLTEVNVGYSNLPPSPLQSSFGRQSSLASINKTATATTVVEVTDDNYEEEDDDVKPIDLTYKLPLGIQLSVTNRDESVIENNRDIQTDSMVESESEHSPVIRGEYITPCMREPPVTRGDAVPSLADLWASTVQPIEGNTGYCKPPQIPSRIIGNKKNMSTNKGIVH